MESRKIIVNLILFLVIVQSISADIEKIYVVNLKYEKGTISLVDDVYVKSGYPQGRKIQPDFGYKCEVMSFEDKELYSFKFELNTRWFYDYLDPKTVELHGGVIKLEDVNFVLTIPYFKNGRVIKIYDPTGKKVLEVDISQFADVCGDGICQDHENPKTCPQDCEKKETTYQWFLYLSVLGILILAILLMLSKFRKKIK